MISVEQWRSAIGNWANSRTTSRQATTINGPKHGRHEEEARWKEKVFDFQTLLPLDKMHHQLNINWKLGLLIFINLTIIFLHSTSHHGIGCSRPNMDRLKSPSAFHGVMCSRPDKDMPADINIEQSRLSGSTVESLLLIGGVEPHPGPMMAADELLAVQKQIIKDLSEIPKEPEIKEIIKKYDSTQDANCIFKELSKYKVADLKLAASFLSNKQPEELKLRKDEWVNMIITKIENHMPEHCKCCDESYTVQFGSTPTLSCLLCGQGAHDKCLNEMLEERGLPKLPGLVWMCPFCKPRATVGDLKGNKQLLKGKKNDSNIEPINVDQENEVNTKEETDKKQEDDKTKNTKSIETQTTGPTTKGKDASICPDYKNKRCIFGLKGKGCKFMHPKPCKRFLSFGDKDPRGCMQGQKCDKFHPRMCRYSLQKT